MRALFICVAALSLLSSSCRYGMGKRVRGDGNSVVQNRQPGSFSKVEQKGSFDIILKNGPVQEVMVDAEENISKYIETRVDNNTLVIRTESGFRLIPTRDIKIVVTSPSFAEVWSNGSGNITSENLLSDSGAMLVGTRGSGDVTLQLQAPEISAESYGSGDIQLRGETRLLNLSSAGSGNLTAADLKAEDATIDITGSGNATVNASKTIDVSVKGSGDVGYKGNPSIKSSIRGSGSLNKIE
jgi:Putative auto-transporter adhesin, head GIN domain